MRYTLASDVAASVADDFLDRFLEHAIEAQQLRCAGGGRGGHWDFIVTAARRGSPSRAQHDSVGFWLAEQPEVASYVLGDFFDVWHGPEEPPFQNRDERS